jgi:rhodanese-related sulfurtransferase
VDPDYTPEQVAELLAREEIQLVDVREPHEHQAGRIDGDRHIEMAELSARAGEIDREVPVVFYCRTGARSGMVTEAFLRAGFDAHNLEGGIVEWRGRGLPIVPDGGFIADP